MDSTAAVEIALLAGGAGLLVWASLTDQSWTTVTGLVKAIQGRLGPNGRKAFAGFLAAALAYLWWHFIFG